MLGTHCRQQALGARRERENRSSACAITSGEARSRQAALERLIVSRNQAASIVSALTSCRHGRHLACVALCVSHTVTMVSVNKAATERDTAS